jgi:hypothetical protein
MLVNDTAIFQDNVLLVIDERMSMMYWWNENDTEKSKKSEGNQFQCMFTTNPATTGLKLYPGLRGEKPTKK